LGYIRAEVEVGDIASTNPAAADPRAIRPSGGLADSGAAFARPAPSPAGETLACFISMTGPHDALPRKSAFRCGGNRNVARRTIDTDRRATR